MLDKIKKFAELVQVEQIERLKKLDLACEANVKNCQTWIKEGKKYIKVNIGTSGRFMIDQEGNIFGIKAYNVIHKGHHYGTLDTIDQYNWGDYYPIKKGV